MALSTFALLYTSRPPGHSGLFPGTAALNRGRWSGARSTTLKLLSNFRITEFGNEGPETSHFGDRREAANCCPPWVSTFPSKQVWEELEAMTTIRDSSFISTTFHFQPRRTCLLLFFFCVDAIIQLTSIRAGFGRSTLFKLNSEDNFQGSVNGFYVGIHAYNHRSTLHVYTYVLCKSYRSWFITMLRYDNISLIKGW